MYWYMIFGASFFFMGMAAGKPVPPDTAPTRN